jgi:hypothetical protein
VAAVGNAAEFKHGRELYMNATAISPSEPFRKVLRTGAVHI